MLPTDTVQHNEVLEMVCTRDWCRLMKGNLLYSVFVEKRHIHLHCCWTTLAFPGVMVLAQVSQRF